MALAVIFLDVSEVRRFSYPLHIPVHILQKSIQERVVVPDGACGEFEMLNVDGVKADECIVELDVKLCHAATQNKWPTVVFEHRLEPVECFEDDLSVLLLVLLSARKASLVDAFVQITRQPRIDIVDLTLQVWWIEIQLSLFASLLEEIVERCVEHPHNVVTFVVDDLFRFLAPQKRYGVFPFIAGKALEVDIMQKFRTEKVIYRRPRIVIIGLREAPTAVILRVGFDNAHWQELLEAFQFTGEEGSMGERAEKADVKVISISFGWELHRTHLFRQEPCEGVVFGMFIRFLMLFRNSWCLDCGKERRARRRAMGSRWFGAMGKSSSSLRGYRSTYR